MSRYIIYKSRSGSEGKWESRLLAHTGSLTDILGEHFDSSKKPLPKPGDRLIEFADLEDKTDSTHYNRNGSWVVTEIDVFTASSVQNGKHSEIVICWCKYDPVEPHWMPVTEGKPVSEMLSSLSPHPQPSRG